MRRPHLALVLAAAALALTACAPSPDSTSGPSPTGLTGPDGGGTVDGTDDGGAGGGDPFPPEVPTTLDGWKARYQNLPWLSDDLDNDDYFITGSADGHEVMGFLCGYDGNPQGYAWGVDGTYVQISFQSATELDVTASRGQYLTFIGTGGYALPGDPQGTHEVVPSFSESLEHDATPGNEKSTPTTAAVSFDFLGVPIPDAERCDRESSELNGWIMSEFGY